MKFVCLRLCFVYLMFIFGFLACKKEDIVTHDHGPEINEIATLVVGPGNDAAVAVSWYQLQLKLIKETSGFTPPVAARAIAYTGITLHEAAVWGARGASSLKGQLNGLSYVPAPERGKKYNWAIAANSAMAAIIKNLFPNANAANLALITQLEIDNLEAYSDSCAQEEIIRSVNFGRQVAGSIYQWSTSDGGKDGYANTFPPEYVPPVGPGLWVSTPPAFQPAMLPYWGNNRPIIRANTSDSAGIRPPVYSTDTTSVFYNEAFLVYHTGVTLTPEQNLIARYWADGGGTFTPPGHLIAITAQLISEQHLSLSAAAKLFAQVGIGLNDAGILCWKYKYKYNLLRPITYIRANINSTWLPLIGTPPFPSYTSGHATFTSAAGHILAAYFGTGFSFTDNQKVPEGFTPRFFNGFVNMIDEAAISRVYGGIHYEFDSEVGKQTGGDIAERVLSLRY
ncbi:PAP2 superfamily protein [Chitinophaga sp. CF118]|uniref:vanadium-dependent haloperoxidase n=1 Tax=Chitinophaga sp. CF118 TaxID=1884367 RepID=UPI0008EA3E10|nr:vanadium-dependent haloperoxidase [Chitinophaga sp. CF118]SFE08178.1 PAP2 superfamily protein [Chitinophaga sp. CF118]